jgi:hypothetical protein
MATYTTPRSIVTQVLQIGVETEPGVGGSPTTRLSTLNSALGPVASGAFGVFRPSGGKYVGQIVPSDMYSEGALNDTIDFNTGVWLTAGNVGYDTTTANPTGDATAGYLWTAAPTPYDADNCVTYVIQEGSKAPSHPSGATAAVYTYRNVAIPDLNFHLMRTGTVTVGGRMLGRKMAPGTAFIAATAIQGGRAMSPLAAGLFSAADWAGLATGGALVPPGVDFVFRHNGVFAPWFALDDSVDSFEGLLDGPIDSGIQVTVPANVVGTDLEGMFNMQNMNEGTPLFLKLLALGAFITPAVFPLENDPTDPRYMFQIKMRAIISAPPRRGAQGNLRTWQFDATLIPDVVNPTDVPFEIQWRNKVAHL